MNDMGKKIIRLAAILALFLASGQVLWAQAKVGSGVITAETQFYLKQLEAKNQQVNTRGSKVRQREAKLFVVCKPEADVNAVKAQIKALGAHLKGTVDRTIMVSVPVEMVEKMATIEGIHYITKGPRVRQKTHVSREVTGVNQVHDGVAPLPQAYTGKGVIVGIIDKGFDYTHPVFKDKDNNLRIKAVYLPSVAGEEPIATADGDYLDGTLITDAAVPYLWATGERAAASSLSALGLPRHSIPISTVKIWATARLSLKGPIQVSPATVLTWLATPSPSSPLQAT